MRSFCGNLRVIGSAWDVVLAVVAGGALYAIGIHALVDRAGAVPIARQRLVETHRFLAAQAQRDRPGSAVYLLGSSVLVEGVDCDIIDAHLPAGIKSYNLGSTGMTPRQIVLSLPAVEAAQPRAVVLCIDVAGAIGTSPNTHDILALANWWNFVPEDRIARLSETLTPAELADLQMSKWRVLMELRIFPPSALDGFVREVARRDLRYGGYTTNFRAPWIRWTPVSDAGMERQFKTWSENLNHATDANRAAAMRVIAFVVDELRRASVPTLVVFPPMHPELAARLAAGRLGALREELARICAKHEVVFLDHGDWLSGSEFSDPVHPFGEGRRRWSERLGNEIARLLEGR